jgi:hypothetical protein
MRHAALFRCVLVLMAATGISLGAVVAAHGDTVVNETMPYTATTFSDCTNENVLVTGQMHVLMRSGTSGDRQHFGADVHITGVKGTGLISGAQYVEMDVNNTQTNIAPGGQQEFTVERPPT